jgi:hypothetical protein
VSLHDDSALGDGPEEIVAAEVSLRVQVEELEVLKEIGVETDVREGLELDLVKQLCLESALPSNYAAMASSIQIIRL